MSATYLYGIVGSGDAVDFPFDGVAKGRRGVHTVPYRDIAAVVGPSELADYRGLGREHLGRVLIAHQRVVEGVMRTLPVLPAKFSTVLPDEQRVPELLARGHGVFRRTLDDLADHAQMEVVVQWDLQSVFAEIGRDEDIVRLKAAAAAADPNHVLVARIALGQAVQAMLEERKEAIAASLLPRLRGLAHDSIVNPVMDDNMVLNVALLLDTAGQARLDALLPELDAELGGKLSFRCVGPLPPYSFHVLEVLTPGFAEIDGARRLLELPEEVTARDVKRAYYRLAGEAHPDQNPEAPDAEERMTELSRAYALLTRIVTAQTDEAARADTAPRSDSEVQSAASDSASGGPLVSLAAPAVAQALLFEICRQEVPAG